MSGLHAGLHWPAAREWCEPHLHASNLVFPLFVTEREEDKVIAGMEPNKQWGAGSDKSYSTLIAYLKELSDKGLRSVMFFGVVDDKDAIGRAADRADTPVILAMKAIRKEIPSMMCLADVCLCEYTDHGHCGSLRQADGEELICNASTVSRLADVALAYAKAGAHWVCPSDMMDGRIAAIRKILDDNQFSHVGIMAYTSKKASSMYEPFRAAVDSTFKGDRKRYQQPVGSIVQARQALARDQAEGASVVLVKPCLFYGDIVAEYARKANVPVACYVVSGEYVMLKGYAQKASLENVLRESHIGLLRAGASIIVTYFTPELLDLIPKWK